MASFQSNEEFFSAVRDLITQLEIDGHPRAALELSEGFGCLNGLTDGWSLFLESVEKIRADQSERFSTEHRSTLERIRTAARDAVRR